MRLSLAAVTLFAALAGSAFAQNAKSIAEQGNQKWVKAYNASDASALTMLYAKDAILLPPGIPEPLRGHAGIEKFFDGMVKQHVDKFVLLVTEARMIGPDTLYDAGPWSGDVPGANGAAAMHIAGTYLNIWVHEGSDWRLQADTWNMIPPAEK